MINYRTLFYALTLSIYLTGCATTTPQQQPVLTEPPLQKPASSTIHSKPSSWILRQSSEIDYLYISFILALQDNDKKTAHHYADTLRQHKLSEKLYTELASFYIMEGNKDAAIATLEESILQYPDTLSLLLLWVDSVDDKTKAIRKMEQFLERNKNNAQARMKLYSLYYNQRQFRSMLTLSENVPKKIYTYMDDFYTAIAWNMLGNKERAVRYFNLCLEKNSSFIEGWFELGLVYENAHDYTIAQKIYAEGLRKNPNYPELWMRLIAINIILNKPRTALEYVKQGPQDKFFLLSAVTIFIENEYYTQASQILKMIEQMYPSSKEVYFYYAFLSMEKDKNIDLALEYLGRIPQDSPLYTKSVQLKVNLYQSQKKHAKAIEVARLAKEAMPEQAEFWDVYAQTVRIAKDYPKAIAIYEEGLQQFPESIPLLYGLASVYNDKDNIAKAMELMEQIILLDNDNVLALNYVGYTLIENNDELPRAKMLLEKAYFLDNDNVSVIDSLAWLYYKQKRYYDAMALLNKAKELGIEDPIIWEHYAEVAKELGLKEDVIYAYKKLLEYNPQHTKAKEYLSH